MKAKVWTCFAWFTCFIILAGIYMAFLYARSERYMGDLQRLMYFHVASAWVAMLAFFVVLIASSLYLLRRKIIWDVLAVASTEVGLFFTTLVLITGPIWARPIWNAWWTWDPRLTTTLILWFIYLAYFLLRASIADDRRKRVVSAVFGIIGFLDVPIVHFSVTWWRSIHPNVISADGMQMDSTMSLALLINGFAFVCLYILLVVVRTKLGILQEQAVVLQNQFFERMANDGKSMQ